MTPEQSFNTPAATIAAQFQRNLEAHRAKAMTRQEQLREQQLAVAGRKQLTPRAREVTTARVYLEGSDQLSAMRQAELDMRRTTRDKIGRKYFSGKANDPISRRDAMDRARALTDERDARDALAAAQRDGDEAMTAAIAEHALGMLWLGVVNEWAADKPGATEDINLYRQLAHEPSYVEAAVYEAIPAGAVDGKPWYTIVTTAQEDLGGDAA
ncbi:hypothetical protein [Streptomyces sp. C1-2]|uniref:hypothetical protein n=1 Tax=Streptomyces sp. C1-2 TaxID=2720022 RepID=UPI001432474E|nr:hypothetical protein [Streptomyces sp. C1-2]NJP72516.1 hypothetical protein [Streptomyces sp. C1-2]